MRLNATTICLTAFALLLGCGEREVILPGERLGLRDGMAGADVASANISRPLVLAAPVTNADWPQVGGSASHNIAQPALAGNLTQIFAVNIGQGDSRQARITASPVVAGGVVYTLDARARVTATAVSGAPVWATDLTPVTDGAADASGGGISVSGPLVFVATGFGELTALNAASGAVVWTQDLNAPGGPAPTVLGDTVYVVSRDGRAWALDVASGLVRWQLAGTPSGANVTGGAGAAVTADIAIFPFPSGEVIAAFPQGGLRRWAQVIAGDRLGSATALAATDIAGDPVIAGDTVYVGNVSGRLVAMNAASGDRIWTATEGVVSPVVPAGGSVFLVNDVNELVRLDAADGSVIWRIALPRYAQGRGRRQQPLFAQFGPVLAGGRLLVASAEGIIRQFDPVSGASLGDIALPGGAASDPVVAGGTLYVVTKSGQLVAFR